MVLKGRIPLSARIVALADVYDALVCKRVYKEAFQHDMAKSIIEQERGKDFDPMVVEAFLSCEDKFIEISERFSKNHTRIEKESGKDFGPMVADTFLSSNQNGFMPLQRTSGV